MLSGLGLALSFVPVSIGGLAGVRPANAGVASGLINTTQQIGGAVGVAIATTIAATLTGHFVSSHGRASPLTGAALIHGFHGAFWVLAALALVGAVAAALLVERPPKPRPEEVEVEDVGTTILEVA